MQDRNVAELISKWLEDKPSWYSFALHVALQGEGSPDDVDALAKAACRDHGIDDIIACDKQIKPYSQDDLDNVGLSGRER